MRIVRAQAAGFTRIVSERVSTLRCSASTDAASFSLVVWPPLRIAVNYASFRSLNLLNAACWPKALLYWTTWARSCWLASACCRL